MNSILEACKRCGKNKIDTCVYPCLEIEKILTEEGLDSKKDYNSILYDDRKKTLDPTEPGFDLDEKTRKKIKEYVIICDRKSRSPVKYYFYVFLRCDNENVIAERLNQSPNNISKKFIRICKCIGEMLNKSRKDKIDFSEHHKPYKSNRNDIPPYSCK